MSSKINRLAGTVTAVGAALVLSVLGASPASAVPGSDPSRPGTGEYGYTSCWETEVNRTDVTQINPFDARSWPSYVTPAVGQPGYVAHSIPDWFGVIDPSEGPDIWERVAQDDPRLMEPPGIWDTNTRHCNPDSGPFYSTSAATENLDPNGSEVARVGDTVQIRNTFTAEFPAEQWGLDFNGDPVSYYFAGEKYRFAPPTITTDPSWPVEGITTSCDSLDAVYDPGETASIICTTRAQIAAEPADSAAAYNRSWLYAAIGLEVAYPASPGAFFPLGSPIEADPASFLIDLSAALPERLPDFDRITVNQGETVVVTKAEILEWASKLGDFAGLSFKTDGSAGHCTVTSSGDLTCMFPEVGGGLWGYEFELSDISGTVTADGYGDFEVLVKLPPVTCEAIASDPDWRDNYSWSDGTSHLNCGEKPKPPVIEPPIVLPPVIEPPVVEPPAVEPPIVQPPVNEAPVMEPPTLVPPIAELPVVEPPTPAAVIAPVSLAETGIEGSALGTIALTVLALGTLLVLVGRRRRALAR